MPIYVYACPNPDCGDEAAEEAFLFETFFSEHNELSERDWAPCPKCGRKAKKVPALTARCKWDWSRWNAM